MKLIFLLLTWWLYWTASGDDGRIGQATGTVLEASKDQTWQEIDTVWTPTPSPPGSVDSTAFSSVWDTTYLRIFTYDEVGNVSDPSNIVILIDRDPPLPITDLSIIGPSGSTKGVGFTFTVPDTEKVLYWIREFEDGLPIAKSMWEYPGYDTPFSPSYVEGQRDTFVLSITAEADKEFLYLLYREPINSGISSRSSNRVKLWTHVDTTQTNLAFAGNDTTLYGWVSKGNLWYEPNLKIITTWKHAIWDTNTVSIVNWRAIQEKYYWQIWEIYGYVYFPAP